MPRVCNVCGKGTTSGRAKHLGGVGLKTTGVSKRKFRPNLQRVKVLENGCTVHRLVCTRCIRDCKVTKAVK